jgi:hemoglobin
MKDIANRDDIILMVDTFYDKVNNHDQLSHIFNDFAKTDWEVHLPRMYDFWETLIFSTGKYKGSPFSKHVPLPVDQSHFQSWIDIFESNLDEHFAGTVTESVKARANMIAQTFQHKLAYLKQPK